MPEQRPAEPFEPRRNDNPPPWSGNDVPLFADGHRATHRRIFREMIKLEIREFPLGRYRRRALVRFAGRLGIDEAEAQTLIRAVEIECGHVAPAPGARPPNPHTSHTGRRLPGEKESGPVWLDRNLLWTVALAAVVLLFWLLR